MYKIKTMNHISPCGLQKLEEHGCVVGENIPDPDGLILRSANLPGRCKKRFILL